MMDRSDNPAAVWRQGAAGEKVKRETNTILGTEAIEEQEDRKRYADRSSVGRLCECVP